MTNMTQVPQVSVALRSNRAAVQLEDLRPVPDDQVHDARFHRPGQFGTNS